MSNGQTREVVEQALVAGARGGWAAACYTIARMMRDAGATSAAGQIEAMADRCPEMSPVRMRPGETPEQAIKRTETEDAEREILEGIWTGKRVTA